MRVNSLGAPPPSPPLQPGRQEGLNPVDNNALRLLGQNAVLNMQTREFLEAVPMQRAPRRPVWANLSSASSSATRANLSAMSRSPVSDTSFWMQPIWEINGVIIPVKVASDKVDLGGPGVVQALASLSLLSPNLLNQLVADRFSMVAVNRSVVEASPELRGVRAGGNQSTWDKIPCAHAHDKKVVTFSTSGNHTGSYDSLLHELFHAIDDTDENLRSSKMEFQEAYDKDKPRIMTHYYLQTGSRGTSGRQETFAEAGARYLASDPNLKHELPAIYQYFDSHFRNDQAYAKVQSGKTNFRPTSEIYAHRGGYKSFATAAESAPSVMSIDDYLARAVP